MGVNSKCAVQSKRRCESHESWVCIVGFSACGCQKKSVVYETECRHVAVQRDKHTDRSACLLNCCLFDSFKFISPNPLPAHSYVWHEQSFCCCSVPQLNTMGVTWSFSPVCVCVCVRVCIDMRVCVSNSKHQFKISWCRKVRLGGCVCVCVCVCGARTRVCVKSTWPTQRFATNCVKSCKTIWMHTVNGTPWHGGLVSTTDWTMIIPY